MATEDRTAPSVVGGLTQLAERPYAFDFYQAVRLIECAYPDRPRIGHAQRPTDEMAMEIEAKASARFQPNGHVRASEHGHEILICTSALALLPLSKR